MKKPSPSVELHLIYEYDIVKNIMACSNFFLLIYRSLVFYTIVEMYFFGGDDTHFFWKLSLTTILNCKKKRMQFTMRNKFFSGEK